MPILQTPLFGPIHGQGVVNSIQRTYDHVLLADHGSLYPALQRPRMRGWITAKWERLTAANAHIMRPTEEET